MFSCQSSNENKREIERLIEVKLFQENFFKSFFFFKSQLLAPLELHRAEPNVT